MSKDDKSTSTTEGKEPKEETSEPAKPKKPASKSTSSTLTMGEFLSNSKKVKKHSKYLETGFRKHCRQNKLFNLPLAEWEKEFNDFINQ